MRPRVAHAARPACALSRCWAGRGKAARGRRRQGGSAPGAGRRPRAGARRPAGRTAPRLPSPAPAPSSATAPAPSTGRISSRFMVYIYPTVALTQRAHLGGSPARSRRPLLGPATRPRSAAAARLAALSPGLEQAAVGRRARAQGRTADRPALGARGRACAAARGARTVHSLYSSSSRLHSRLERASIRVGKGRVAHRIVVVQLGQAAQRLAQLRDGLLQAVRLRLLHRAWVGSGYHFGHAMDGATAWQC